MAVIMLLPVEEKKQVQLAASASHTAERTATFCERNPSTCANGRDLWALFLQKAEFGLELGSRLLREYLLRSATESRPEQPVGNQPSTVAAPLAQASPAAHASSHPSRLELPPPPSRRTNYTMDHPSRWR